MVILLIRKNGDETRQVVWREVAQQGRRRDTSIEPGTSTTQRKSSASSLCHKANKMRAMCPAKLAGQLRYAVLDVHFVNPVPVCFGRDKG